MHRQYDRRLYRPTETLSLHVAVSAIVSNTITDSFMGNCGDPGFSTPTISLGHGSSVTSEGLVFAGGVCGWGIAVGDDSTVVQSGSMVTSENLGYGIVTGDRPTIVNNGLIITLGQTGEGIFAGSLAQVINAVGATITTFVAAGINVFENATVVNDGTITTQHRGIVAGGGGTSLANTGTITANGQSTFGVVADGGDIALTNSGSIRSVFDGQTAAGQHGAGVLAAGDGLSIVNSGTISGSFAGLQLAPTGSASVNNTGTIIATGERNLSGDIFTGGGALVSDSSAAALVRGKILAPNGDSAVAGGDGREQILNFGVIDGDVRLAGGDDSVRLFSGSTVTATIDGGTGTDTLSLNDDGIISGQITNFAFLTVSGSGAWQLGTDLAVGTQGVEAVVLLGSGSTLVAPQLSLAPSGTMVSEGTLRADTVNNGVLVPSRLTIGGDFT